MRQSVVLLAMLAIGCKKDKAPEWQVSGVGNLHVTGALELFDKSTGNHTECGLAGVWEPGDDNGDLKSAYRDALGKLVTGKTVDFTVVETAPTVAETKTTRGTAGVDQCDVTLAGIPLAPTLVASGWGRAKPGAPKPIIDAEAKARAAHLGMWSPEGRALALGPFAKLNDSTVDKLPVHGDLSWAQKQVPAWQDKLAYADIGIEDVIVVDGPDGKPLAHWSAPKP